MTIIELTKEQLDIIDSTPKDIVLDVCTEEIKRQKVNRIKDIIRERPEQLINKVIERKDREIRASGADDIVVDIKLDNIGNSDNVAQRRGRAVSTASVCSRAPMSSAKKTK